MTERPTVGQLQFHEVTADRWPDFERLFEARGGPKSCWCMVWRASPAEAKHTDGASRKAAMAARICAGALVGLLGYTKEEPVAWCSIAPRSTYRRLVSGETSDEGIWSIACFFVVRRLRGAGITQQLIAAAVRHARQHGAALPALSSGSSQPFDVHTSMSRQGQRASRRTHRLSGSLSQNHGSLDGCTRQSLEYVARH